GSAAPAPGRQHRPAAGTARGTSAPAGRPGDRASGCPPPSGPPPTTSAAGRPPTGPPTRGGRSRAPAPSGWGGTRGAEDRGGGPRPAGRPSPRGSPRSPRPAGAPADPARPGGFPGPG